MKFWKRIFFYSIILFIILFNGAGIVLIEKIHKDNMNNIINSTINQYSSVITVLYLNTDLNINDLYAKSSVDAEVGLEEGLIDYNSQQIDIMLTQYIANESEGRTNLEVFNKNNKLIVSKSNIKVNGERREVINATNKEKSFLIRTVEDKKYLFISSLVKIQNQNIKLVLSKDISNIYQSKKANYEFFIVLDVITIIILAIGMYIVSKKITEPIVKLSNASIEIANGNYNKRVEVSMQKDEIGILSKNFNSMINVIDSNIKDLNNLNDSKQRFIDSLTHEIKTPITSIIGYSDLLLRSKVSKEVENKALVYINSQAKRLEELNNTLLKLILVREEKLNIDLVDVKEVVDKSIEALTYKLQSKGLSLNISISEGSIYGDKQLIVVLLTNIIDNSIKASKEADKIIVIGINQKENYILSIKDFGVGISKEDVDKITEPFYMIDKSRTGKTSGMGLGLAICKEICLIHNINLEIKSELNKGTEIIMKFSKEIK